MELRRGDGSVIAVNVVGEQDASPVLLCHGLADSRLSADWFGQAARDLGLCVIAPDRPGTGGTDLRQLRCLADWVEDAMLVLDALRADAAALLGISAGGQPGMRESFLASYVEAFLRGSGGVAQDLRVLTRPWGFDLGSIHVPALIRHGDAEVTVPLPHARRYAEAIPGAQLRIHPGHGHFSILSAPREILAAFVG